MNTNGLLNFLDEIVQKEFPAEAKIFDSSKLSLLSKMKEEGDINEIGSESGAHDEFMSVEGPVVASFALLAGTVKTVMEMTNSTNRKNISGESLRKKWKTKLKGEGFSDEEAERFAEQYMNELLTIL